MPDEQIGFRPFGAMHLVVVAGFVCTVLAILWIATRLRRRGRIRSLDVALAVVAGMTWVTINGWQMLPRNFDARYTLPIHVSDLCLLLMPVMLLCPARPLRAAAYFFGLGLGVQAFITPDLRDGPASPGFWMFWISHYLIVGIAIYDLAARGYRPGWRDWRIALLIALVYFGMLVPVNIALGANYGYVGPTAPGQPTLIDYLGPWPWRLLPLAGLGVAWMTLLVIPWELIGARKRAEPA